jgi:DNA-binding NarL/FixJ family response regulator
MSAYILILDDDADVATRRAVAAAAALRAGGHLCDPAGLPALLARGVPDVVLLDLNFTPGSINGAEGLALLDVLRVRSRVLLP